MTKLNKMELIEDAIVYIDGVCTKDRGVQLMKSSAMDRSSHLRRVIFGSSKRPV